MNLLRKQTKNGFTLVELLVVISIIALLVSILMPALGKARDQAKAIKCLAHLKAIGSGFALYASENNGAVVQGFLEDKIVQTGNVCNEVTWLDVMVEYQGDPKVRICPTGNAPNKCGYTGQSNGNTEECWGAKDHVWHVNFGCDLDVEVSRFEGSYGVNGFAHGSYTESDSYGQPSEWHWGNMDTGPTNEIPLALDMIMTETYIGNLDMDFINTKTVTSSQWKSIIPPSQAHVDALGWPDSAPKKPPVLTPQWTTAVSDNAARVFLARHPNNTINMVYMDGHGSKVPLVEIFEQEWHRNYHKHYRDDINNLTDTTVDYQWFVD